jgi:hypothetical protein
MIEIGGDAQSATDLKDFADAGYDPGTNKVNGVKLVDALTTYTGNTPQTGDSFTKIGTPVALDGGAATLGGMLTKIADDNGGADYDAATDSLHEGGGGTGLNAQQTRDAMKLSPTAGAPGADSIDADLDVIKTDVAGMDGDAIPSAEEIVDEWESQSQADPTGFHVNLLEIVGTAAPQTTGKLHVLDGDGNAIATASQVQGIANVGAATNKLAVDAPNGFVLTTGGGEVNDEDSTHALDGIEHQFTDTAGTLDAYYIYDLEGVAAPVSVTLTARIMNSSNSVGVYVNVGGTQASPVWEQRGDIPGQNQVTNIARTFTLFVNDIMTGVDAGKVAVRLFNTGLSSATMYVDQGYVSQSADVSLTGYANGWIFINTVGGGEAGDVVNVNGTADNASDNLTDALSLSTQTGLATFSISPLSTVNLIADATGMVGLGNNWNLGLAGQIISGATILGANVSGSSDASSTTSEFVNCHLAVTGLTPANVNQSSIDVSVELLATGDYRFTDCVSGVAGSAAPVIDMGAGIGGSDLEFRRWSGGLTITNINTDDVVSVDALTGGTLTLTLAGGLVEARGAGMKALVVNGSSGTVNVAGFYGTITDNSGGSVTINTDWSLQQMMIDGVAGLPTTAEFEARTIIAADYGLEATNQLIVEDTGTTLPAQITSVHGVTDGKVDSVQVDTTAIVEDTGTTLPAQITSVHGVTDGKVDAVKAETVLIVEDTGTTLPAQITSVHGVTDGKVDAVKAETVLIVEDTGTTLPAQITSVHGVTDGKVDAVQVDTTAIVEDTGTTIPAQITSEHSTTDALIGAIPTNPNTVIPDIAGTAAGLHSTTDALIGAIPTNPNTVVPDVAGTAATLHGITDGKVDAVKVDTAAVKVVTDRLDGMLIIDGSVYQYTTNALENAPGGMTTVQILPLFATTTESGLQAINRLSAYQHADFTVTFGVFDNSKPRQPIDLSAVALTWIAWVATDPETIILTLTTAGGKITVDGDDNNQVTLLGDTTDTAVAYKSLKWRLIGTTNDTQYANGFIDINESAQPI